MVIFGDIRVLIILFKRSVINEYGKRLSILYCIDKTIKRDANMCETFRGKLSFLCANVYCWFAVPSEGKELCIP